MKKHLIAAVLLITSQCHSSYFGTGDGMSFIKTPLTPVTSDNSTNTQVYVLRSDNMFFKMLPSGEIDRSGQCKDLVPFKDKDCNSSSLCTSQADQSFGIWPTNKNNPS